MPSPSTPTLSSRQRTRRLSTCRGRLAEALCADKGVEDRETQTTAVRHAEVVEMGSESQRHPSRAAYRALTRQAGGYRHPYQRAPHSEWPERQQEPSLRLALLLYAYRHDRRCRATSSRYGRYRHTCSTGGGATTPRARCPPKGEGMQDRREGAEVQAVPQDGRVDLQEGEEDR